MKHLIFGLLLFFAAGMSQAYSTKGTRGCGQYVDDYDKDGWAKIANQQWLLGFISGYNGAMDSDLGKEVDIESITLHAYNYCKENPLKDTSDAARDLIISLDKDS